MIIATPVANDLLCMHFGHCQTFRLFEINNDKKIVKSEDKVPPPHEPGVLPKWLGDMNVDLIIAGGMGMRAQQLFAQAGVKVVTGAPGEDPEKIVEAFLANSLETGENACDH